MSRSFGFRLAPVAWCDQAATPGDHARAANEAPGAVTEGQPTSYGPDSTRESKNLSSAASPAGTDATRM